jgi:type III secretory pathway component EscU
MRSDWKREMAQREGHSEIRQIERQLEQTVHDLRQNVQQAEEPQLKAILETSAEVIGGLVKTLKDYEKKKEPAWH